MKTFTTTYTSPLGPIVIESDGQAITSLRFSNEQVLADSTGQGEEILKEAATAPPIIAETTQWLDDYFAGKRPCNVPRLGPHGTAFQKRVWTALFTIWFGQTKTYGEIAKMVDCRPLPPSHCSTWQNRRVRIRNGDKKETSGTGRKSY